MALCCWTWNTHTGTCISTKSGRDNLHFATDDACQLENRSSKLRIPSLSSTPGKAATNEACFLIVETQRIRSKCSKVPDSVFWTQGVQDYPCLLKIQQVGKTAITPCSRTRRSSPRCGSPSLLGARRSAASCLCAVRPTPRPLSVTHTFRPSAMTPGAAATQHATSESKRIQVARLWICPFRPPRPWTPMQRHPPGWTSKLGRKGRIEARIWT